MLFNCSRKCLPKITVGEHRKSLIYGGYKIRHDRSYINQKYECTVLENVFKISKQYKKVLKVKMVAYICWGILYANQVWR